MKDKIKDFIVASKLDIYFEFNAPREDWYCDELEEFANLIIRDCANIAAYSSSNTDAALDILEEYEIDL
jgi:phage gp36-like protein